MVSQVFSCFEALDSVTSRDFPHLHGIRRPFFATTSGSSAQTFTKTKGERAHLHPARLSFQDPIRPVKRSEASHIYLITLLCVPGSIHPPPSIRFMPRPLHRFGTFFPSLSRYPATCSANCRRSPRSGEALVRSADASVLRRDVRTARATE